MNRSSASRLPTALLALAAQILAIVLALSTFAGTLADIAQRRGAMLLAGQVISSCNDTGYPETGVFLSTAHWGGIDYTIRRTVIEVSPGIREMQLFVGSGNEIGIEFIRRYFSFGQL